MKTDSVVAYATAKDGYSPDKIYQILLDDLTLIENLTVRSHLLCTNYLLRY